MKPLLILFRVAVFCLFIVGVGLLPQTATAQEKGKPIVLGESFKLQSKVLNEEREIWIYCPVGYRQGEQKYPVMYLLDGDGNFHHTTGIVEFLSRNNLMPQMLVVGVLNTDRTRDLTPETRTDSTNQFPSSGGADNFAKFFQTELIPYIESNYRTHPYRVLVGHSFGGLFAVHAFLNHTDLFNAYVSISPSLWWNNQAPLKQAAAFLPKNSGLKKFLHLSMGNEGGNMIASARGMADILAEKAPAGLRWSFHHLENESHGSIPHRSTYIALEEIFEGWQIPNVTELVQTSGMEAVDRHYQQLSDNFGYTIKAPELLINRLGYWYLGQQDPAGAISLFERNVKDYPGSANVYDSLGDGYDAGNQPSKALESYRKAVQLATESAHPNLGIYKANLERMEQKIASQKAVGGSN